MEAPSTGQQSARCVVIEEGKVFCKCAESWTCDFKKTEPSKVGKPFSTCGGSCICITDATKTEVLDVEKTMESSSAGKVICKVGEGWTCVITKTEGTQVGNTFLECGEGCICVIDEANIVKVASA